MGDWGPGALENDHAQDLLSIEVDRWRGQIAACLHDEHAAWDAVQGPLVYVHLLVANGGVAGELRLQASPAVGASSSAEIATAWKARYLELWSKTPYTRESARQARYDEIVRLFDALITLACTTDAPQKKRATKVATKRR